MIRRQPRIGAAAAVLLTWGVMLAAQPQQQEPRSNVGPADRPRVDPAGADRGRAVWAAECVTCHGSQARGSDQAPSLIRSGLVMRDRAGNELGPFLKKGHPTQSGKPSAGLSDAQILDLLHFLRQRLNDSLRGSELFVPQDILIGDLEEGASYFNGAGGCTACHSVRGDLAGIASRLSRPVDLQQRMLFPIGGRAPAGEVTVRLTPASGRAMSGALVQMDDFYIALRDASGVLHVVKRTPTLKIETTDPLQAHRDLLDRITDKNIHDLVAYLVTLK